MLKFKQYLILEDAEITLRKYLESIYGEHNSKKMISSIREREKEFAENKRKELFSTGLNPDLAYDLDQFKNFNPPIYSDKNLDRPIDVKVIEMKPSQTLIDAGYEPKPLGTGTLVGNEPKDVRGTIKINKDAKFYKKDRFNSADKLYDFTKKHLFGVEYHDIIGHELTHTAQSNSRKRRNTAITQTEYAPDEPASPNASEETLKRRIYTQNSNEPAARMSELKHLYYKSTRKPLFADMTPEEKDDFKSWYDKSKYRDLGYDDTVQLIDTPEGEELFRRVAKANKSNTFNTRTA
jgi:hypothetical protein